MRYLYLFTTALMLFSCAKDDTFDPKKPKNGQIVELFVDHYYYVGNQRTFVIPDYEQGSLYGFVERDLGYTYKVKARVNAPEEPPQDGPSYWFDFMETIQQEKYQGNETFTIPLIASLVPGGPFIALIKEDGVFHYGGILLRPVDAEVEEQLEEIWQHRLELTQNFSGGKMTWEAIEATAKHDPDNYGKGYLIQQIAFTE